MQSIDSCSYSVALIADETVELNVRQSSRLDSIGLSGCNDDNCSLNYGHRRVAATFAVVDAMFVVVSVHNE